MVAGIVSARDGALLVISLIYLSIQVFAAPSIKIVVRATFVFADGVPFGTRLIRRLMSVDVEQCSLPPVRLFATTSVGLNQFKVSTTSAS